MLLENVYEDYLNSAQLELDAEYYYESGAYYDTDSEHYYEKCFEDYCSKYNIEDE